MSLQLVLFACMHNKGRSQIASAFFNQLADAEKARSMSAGLDPAAHVQAEVVEVMREVDIDLSGVRPIELTGRMITELSFLVTLGCPERCPSIPFSRRRDWRLRDTLQRDRTQRMSARSAADPSGSWWRKGHSFFVRPRERSESGSTNAIRDVVRRR